MIKFNDICNRVENNSEAKEFIKDDLEKIIDKLILENTKCCISIDELDTIEIEMIKPKKPSHSYNFNLNIHEYIFKEVLKKYTISGYGTCYYKDFKGSILIKFYKNYDVPKNIINRENGWNMV